MLKLPAVNDMFDEEKLEYGEILNVENIFGKDAQMELINIKKLRSSQMIEAQRKAFGNAEQDID